LTKRERLPPDDRFIGTLLTAKRRGAKMDPKQFAELHAKCWETLKHYVHEADRMCELFGQCLPDPSSIQIRSEIIQQRILENNAYASYAEVRRQLFEATRIGYDALS
jgi:hypothetical protein